jgi:hypothetical protein
MAGDMITFILLLANLLILAPILLRSMRGAVPEPETEGVEVPGTWGLEREEIAA